MYEVLMDLTNDIYCGICLAHHATNPAEHWCTECDEGLCSDCQEQYHRISKSSKHHDTIPIDSHKKLPKYVSEIEHYCKEHDMKYTNYCTSHDSLFCPDCIITHKDCDGLVSLREISKTSKTSAFLKNVEQTLQDIKINFESIVIDRKQNLAKILEQRQKLHIDIKQARATINVHLDNLEHQILEEINRAEKHTKSKIERLLIQLSNEKKNIDELQKNITSVREYASDLQTFLGSKVLEKEVEKQEMYLKSISENNSLQQIELRCNINEKIKDIVATISSLGTISIATSPPIVRLQREKDKSAQFMYTMQRQPAKSIDDISCKLLSTIKIPSSKSETYITACLGFSTGMLIFADCHDHRLVVTNDKGTLEKELPLTGSNFPYGVTSIDDKTLAVSTERGIKIINIETKRIEREIKTSQSCYGIIFNNDALLWSEECKGIFKMPLPDGNITAVVKQEDLPKNSFLAAYGDNILQTNEKTKTVTCYTMEGKKVWEYKDESILADPTGVTVDTYGNIYVTSFKSNSVVVLSSDGAQGRQLLVKEDGMKSPYGIYFDNHRNAFFVSFPNSDVVLLYNV